MNNKNNQSLADIIPIPRWKIYADELLAGLLVEGGKTGNIEMIEYAVQKGAKTLRADNYNWAMATAAGGGHQEIVQMLQQAQQQ